MLHPARSVRPPQRQIPYRSRTRSVLALSVAASFALGACGGGGGGSAAPPGGTSAPLVEVASYPFGDALCAAPTRDGSRIVAAEGAALTVLDPAPLSRGEGAPAVLDRFALASSPYALLFDPPYVFVAGGDHGLASVTLCAGVLTGSEPCASYPMALLADVEGRACLDVARLPGHPAGELVAAVFSSRPEVLAPRLMVFDRDAPHVLRASVDLVAPGATPLAEDRPFALVADPRDSTRVFVAMGTAGVWRVDLSDLTQPFVEPGPRFDGPDEVLGTVPALARDLAIVDAGVRTLLFAAIERGGIAEFDVSDPLAWSESASYARAPLACPGGCSPGGEPYAFRVDARADDLDRLLVVVATNSAPGSRVEAGPFSCLGTWSFDLDLPAPPGAPAGCEPATFVLRGSVGAGSAGTPSVSVIGSACREAEARSIALAQAADGLLLVEQRFDGLLVTALDGAWDGTFSMPSPLAPAYAGDGLTSVDGIASELDPTIVHLGSDAISAPNAGMSRLVVASGTVEVIPGSAALCDKDTSYCNGAETTLNAPNPWIGSLAGGARWSDARDEDHEWFAAGEPRVSRQCASDPCGWTDAWCNDPWLEEGDAPHDDERPPGWEIVRFATSGSNATSDDLAMRFWSIASPKDATGRAGRQYFGALADSRADGSSGKGQLLHLFRSAVRQGYLVCSSTELVDDALGACGERGGKGQRVDPSWLHVLTTHFELEPLDDPGSAITWRGETFQVEHEGSTRTLLALAAGWVLPVPRAPWLDHANRANVVVYDVTDVDATHPPRLLRLLFGPRDWLGNALAVRVARVGERDMLFAGDLAGALHAFDVSSAVLFDDAPADPSDPATALEPEASWFVAPDALDGERANVTDVELDLASDPGVVRVLLANARRGISVVEARADLPGLPVQLGEHPRSPIDTPGVASGLVLTRIEGQDYVVVGDARCGIRVYRLQ